MFIEALLRMPRFPIACDDTNVLRSRLRFDPERSASGAAAPSTARHGPREATWSHGRRAVSRSCTGHGSGDGGLFGAARAGRTPTGRRTARVEPMSRMAGTSILLRLRRPHCATSYTRKGSSRPSMAAAEGPRRPSSFYRPWPICAALVSRWRSAERTARIGDLSIFRRPKARRPIAVTPRVGVITGKEASGRSASSRSETRPSGTNNRRRRANVYPKALTPLRGPLVGERLGGHGGQGHRCFKRVWRGRRGSRLVDSSFLLASSG